MIKTVAALIPAYNPGQTVDLPQFVKVIFRMCDTACLCAGFIFIEICCGNDRGGDAENVRCDYPV